ncbi:hypothetical protein [Burkholderia sp. BCC0322]|uniref:hypothetical protein n=1 Tax=unclassified Burkholderia TaxID=2613784 RepID=UPI00158AAE98|nr:hypothetical protein [Burkholderia sp. BCC0322]
MDYVLANFMAVLAAIIFSVFTSFIASRSGRTAYRKIMWSYLITLLIAAIVITGMQLPFAILAFGALLSCIFGVFAQLAIAVKLGHLVMTDGHYGDGWNKASSSDNTSSDLCNDWFWRDQRNQMSHSDWRH